MKKKIIIVSVAMVFVLSIIGICIIWKNKKLDGNFDYLENGIAIMIDEKGDGEYKPYSSSDGLWPDEDYVIDVLSSTCDVGEDKGLGWDSESNAVTLTMGKSDKCTIYFTKKVKDYDYTGNVQEFVAPATGTYKLEVWGAQGGIDKDYVTGGKGGYSSGIVYLEAGEKLYIVVGGQGSTTEANGVYKGGYNGGGDGFTGTSLSQYAYGGGGATHIAKSKAVLSSLSNKQNDVLIVAGGGGGNGGGSVSAGVKYAKAYGGAGGGSSYISGYKGCVAIKSESTESSMQLRSGCSDNTQDISCSYHYSNKIFTDTNMIAGNASMPNPSGGTETGHEGNGHAKITLVESTYSRKVTKAIDLSGNGYNGEFKGNAEVRKDGDNGYGLHFDGNESFVELPTLPATINWANGFTIEFEAKYEEFNLYSRIFDFGNGTSDNILIAHTYGKNQFHIRVITSQDPEVYLELNKKIKMKIVLKRTSGNNYSAEIYKDDKLEATITFNNLSNLNVERKNNYLGKSNWPDEQVIGGYLHGYIYWLKITDATDKPIVWYDFT